MQKPKNKKHEAQKVTTNPTIPAQGHKLVSLRHCHSNPDQFDSKTTVLSTTAELIIQLWV